MKIVFLHIFLLSTIVYSCHADSISFKKSIPIHARLFSSDPLGNLYIVKDNNTLLKLNSSGDSIGIFNEIKKGKIQSIDASNPLRILLFFADYNQIVILNNMLSQKTTIRLNALGLYNVACIANSADGNIWIYDPSFASLIKINEQMELMQTTNLRNVFENPASPSMMLEHERSLYITDTSEGIRKYDQFAFYNTTYHFKTEQIQLFNNYLVYYIQPNLISYHLLTLVEKKILLPQPENILQVRLERGLLYLLRKDSLDIYEFKAS